MRSASIIFTTLIAVMLMGVGVAIFPFQGLDTSAVASEVAEQEIAAINKAAPKFPRRQVLAPDVKVVLDKGHGSGVFVAPGLVLTAAHVVLNPSKRLDLRFKGGEIRPAEILWVSKDRDIALLKARGDDVAFPRLRCSPPPIGEDVTMAGNPVALEDIIAFGRVAGESRSIGHWKSVFVISGPVIPGQSGGAVYDKDHNLVGISVGLALFPVGFSGSATGYGFAVGGDVLCELLARDA